MFIRKCRDMKTNQKIGMLQNQLQTIANELGMLVAELENKHSKVEKEEIVNQLIEIQDFANS